MEARGRALNREHDDRAWLAWHIAALGRSRRLPDLKRLQHRRRASGSPQTPEQQLQIIKVINAIHGGSVVKKGS